MKASVIVMALIVALSGCTTTKVRIEYVRPKAPKSLVVPCARKPVPTESWTMQSAVKRYTDRDSAAGADCRTRSDAKDKWLIENDLVEK